MNLWTLPLLVTGVVLALPAPSLAADPTSHAGHAGVQTPAAPAFADGVVKKVNKGAATVTIAHGPLNGMPGMTMAFAVKDAAWLDKLKEGQKIRFAADEVKGVLTVVKYEAVK